MPTKAQLEAMLVAEREKRIGLFATIAEEVANSDALKDVVRDVVRDMMHTDEAERWVEDMVREFAPEPDLSSIVPDDIGAAEADHDHYGDYAEDEHEHTIS